MPKNNLKKATKKSIYESKVQQLDQFGTDVGEFIKDETLNVIENIVGDFIIRVQDNILSQTNMITTGDIADITIKPENGAINVYANPHLIYQDRGVNGSKKKYYNTPHAYKDKMPPVSVFKEWIKRKNINLVDNENYRGEPSPFKDLTEEQKINSAAWGMAKTIYKEGFKPRNIYSKEIGQLVNDLQQEIADFCVQAITQSIDVKPSAKRIIKK